MPFLVLPMCVCVWGGVSEFSSGLLPMTEKEAFLFSCVATSVWIGNMLIKTTMVFWFINFFICPLCPWIKIYFSKIKGESFQCNSAFILNIIFFRAYTVRENVELPVSMQLSSRFICKEGLSRVATPQPTLHSQLM